MSCTERTVSFRRLRLSVLLNALEVITVARKIKAVCRETGREYLIFICAKRFFHAIFTALHIAKNFGSKSYTTFGYPTMSGPEGSSIR